MKIDIDFTKNELIWIRSALLHYLEDCPSSNILKVRELSLRYKDWCSLYIGEDDVKDDVKDD